MALINCPECNKEISDTVKKCPYCGYRIKKKNSKKRPLIIVIILAAAIVVGICGTIVYRHNHVSMSLKTNKVELGDTVDLISLTKYSKKNISKVIVKNDGNFSNKKIGKYNVVYTATNIYNKSKDFKYKITVADTVAPSINVSKKKIYIAKGSKFDISKFASAKDESETSFSYDGDLDTNKEGTYDISIYATDKSGNKSTSQKVKVIVSDRSGADFRNAKWGDDKETVKNFETLELDHEGKADDGDGDGDYLGYRGNIGGHNCYILYNFNSKGQLYQGTYVLLDDYTNGEGYIEDFDDLKKIFKKKYKKPDIDKKVVLYPSLYPYVDTDGEALQMGYIVYWTTWKLKNTTIDLFTDTENFDVNVSVRYKSTKVDDTDRTEGI